MILNMDDMEIWISNLRARALFAKHKYLKWRHSICFSQNSTNIQAVSKLWHVWCFRKKEKYSLSLGGRFFVWIFVACNSIYLLKTDNHSWKAWILHSAYICDSLFETRNYKLPQVMNWWWKGYQRSLPRIIGMYKVIGYKTQ